MFFFTWNLSVNSHSSTVRACRNQESHGGEVSELVHEDHPGEQCDRGRVEADQTEHDDRRHGQSEHDDAPHPSAGGAAHAIQGVIDLLVVLRGGHGRFGRRRGGRQRLDRRGLWLSRRIDYVEDELLAAPVVGAADARAEVRLFTTERMTLRAVDEDLHRRALLRS